MYIKRSPGKRVFDALNGLVMVVISFLCLAPMVHVLFASISDPVSLQTHVGLIFLPIGKVTLSGYEMVFRNPNIAIGYANTLFYVGVGTLLSVVLTAIGGYVLSRKQLLWRNAMMFLVTFTMFFNGGIIPFYMVVRGLGMMDTRAAIIIPTALSVFNLIMVRTAFLEIPDSLEESARLDGANDLVILFRIILPVSKAVLAVIALFYAVGRWNEWFYPNVFLRDRSRFPLQVILREILIQNDISNVTSSADTVSKVSMYGTLIKYCTTIVATLPILCVYPFAQKYFVTGVMIGSIKG